MNLITFEQASRELEAMRAVTYAVAESGLISATMCATHAAILNEFAPDRLGEIRGVLLFGSPIHNNIIDMSAIEQAICDVLPTLFPCDVDHLIEEIYNNEGELPYLIWEPVQNFTYDDIGEMALDPQYFGTGIMTSLIIFAWYLCEGVETEYFEWAAEHFTWQIEIPEGSRHNQGFDSVNEEWFYARLDEQNLAEFKLPFQCISHATGNRFLDYTMDEVYEDGMAYCVESIRELSKEWTEAQPRMEALKAAADRFERDKWIAPRIGELWDESIQYKDGRTPRTLMEMWGGVGDPQMDDEEYEAEENEDD